MLTRRSYRPRRLLSDLLCLLLGASAGAALLGFLYAVVHGGFVLVEM